MRSLRTLTRTLSLACILAMIGGIGAAPSNASAAALWRLDSRAAPTHLAPGHEARIIATADNIGDGALNGSGAHPATIRDTLPPGLRIPSILPASIEGRLEANDRSEPESQLSCSVEGPERRAVTCKTTSETQPIAPFTQLRLTVPVEVLSDAASGERNVVSVAGGEMPGGQEPPAPPPISQPLTVDTTPTPFGIERYELEPEEEGGSVDLQAAAHPFQLTTTLDLNQILAAGSEGQAALQASAPSLPRNLDFELPPGLLGDPQAVAQCSDLDFSTIGANNVNACPAASAIGVALVTLNMPNPPLGVFTEAVPVFNLVPAPGEPARFGLEDTKVPIILDTSVRTSGDYGVTVSVRNTTQVAQLLSTELTLWGEPQASAHDASRGWACLHQTEVNGETCTPPATRSTTPFLTLPTACTGPLATDMSGEDWQGDGTSDEYRLKNGLGEQLASLVGCEAVPFDPQIGAVPVEEHEGADPGAPQPEANAPTGMNIDVKLPTEAGGLGEAAIRETTVALPAGVQLNPSAANGLQACSEAQIGYEGPAVGPDPLAPGAAVPLRFSTAPAQCPDASKVGTVRISSPDLTHELTGGVYVAAQEANPFDSLFAIYILAEDPASGIRVKLAGKVSLDEQTGQATTTFQNTPQVPLGELKLHFFEGPTASLSTPPSCGTYTTSASFTPWSSATPQGRESSFAITSGPDGTPCSPTEPFAPVMQTGSSSSQAGAFTNFSLTLGRTDADQQLGAVTVHLPPGIAAVLASVQPCPEPAAANAQCGPESLIGHSVASSGVGPDPVSLPGNVYLTGPYKGAPFGIEVVTRAAAGPFDLGDVVVRSTITVDPTTAAVTISSDPIPTRVKGVPAQIKQLTVTVDRPNFEFNPTSCNPMAITATINGDQGASVPESSRFQVGGCENLPFAPVLNATTPGQGSRANGTALNVKITSAGLGQANIAKVDLRLPKQLPTRQSTIRLACPEATFAANPASCDEGSVIGFATVRTPVLKSPLSGPAYLVSHGGAQFPDVEFVLQGEGVKLILDGSTDIKEGYTYSKFEAAPDAPFTSFETVLPAGAHSALGVYVPEKENYSVCKTSLLMPTRIVSQTGKAIEAQTKITPVGCSGVLPSKAAKPTRAQLLAKALTKCRKKYRHNKHKRQACERAARKRYRLTAHKTGRHVKKSGHPRQRPR